MVDCLNEGGSGGGRASVERFSATSFTKLKR